MVEVKISNQFPLKLVTVFQYFYDIQRTSFVDKLKKKYTYFLVLNMSIVILWFQFSLNASHRLFHISSHQIPSRLGQGRVAHLICHSTWSRYSAAMLT